MSDHLNIYLLDDEPEILELLSEHARLSGFLAHGFCLAEELFSRAHRLCEGALLVLDLHMPGVDGIEVMRRLAELQSAPALILISGQDQSVLHAAKKLGEAQGLRIIGSLSKPLDLPQFQLALREFADGASLSSRQRWACRGRSPLANELHRGIQEDQLVLHYQPQISVGDGRVHGLEALVRWHHPELGIIYPDRFLPLAEESGLADELTHWVLGEVVRQGESWQQQGHPMSVSINISAADITTLTLPEQITQLLSSHRLNPGRLTLEVTESSLMGELVTSLDTLTRLRLKGIGLSIDDFGTGYSSLSQLHRIPFNELKVDHSFVASMQDDGEARAIVKTCIMLGHELNMRVVAEGVESPEILSLLGELGCDIAQGYQIAPAMPGEQLLDWLERWNQGVAGTLSS
jgi:EAL domain-containing protein (putative c-di-GMP-specific phosphodiesterase class I)/CheY-like chemotaxis protein